MKVTQYQLIDRQWQTNLPNNSSANWVLAFGERGLMEDAALQQQIRTAFPHVELIGCSTSGEIIGCVLEDDTLVLSAIEFEHTQVTAVHINIDDVDSPEIAATQLAAQLPTDSLKHVVLLCDGQRINVSVLVKAMESALPEGVAITGGMAGDATRFQKTVLWHNEVAESGLIVACGLYGDAIRVGYGSMGGWEEFGPERIITKAKGNALYELDGQPALQLYKRYLGDAAEQLPASGTRFPLSMSEPGADESVVRSVMSVDEAQQCLYFGGDMPEGAKVKLMSANFDNLIEGAHGAAQHAMVAVENMPAFALLVSCVGRKIVLKQETESELEAVQEVLTSDCTITGFYSYGEISPLLNSHTCSLHNQSMTITTFAEYSPNNEAAE
ncbi:FIST signal transduction protein [Flocculibacter collagenilyticus]|uniref:FIST signal transduction protein n=1 Tax=Flocculibacter collagenilyticus TaxID=2744479 RepID=UPI0018F4BDB1|nr:FIST N-terminal domain-containing protein [Flocculibacter collagenilyticus]